MTTRQEDREREDARRLAAYDAMDDGADEWTTGRAPEEEAAVAAAIARWRRSRIKLVKSESE